MLGEEDDADDLSENYVMRIARWMVDATDQYDGDRFFTRVGGKWRATPMLVVLICIELSDVIFAVDSIPAVVGITQALPDAHAAHAAHAAATPRAFATRHLHCYRTAPRAMPAEA